MSTNKGIAAETTVVILAAGKGTRMGSRDVGKVGFEIDAVPAINRQIRVFKRKGFRGFLLVVGTKAESILDTVAKEHQGIAYVYQEPQLGTGHAAALAAEALKNLGVAGHVLVTMGDKVIEKEAVDALLDGYVKQRADMALLTIPVTKATEGSVGRVFVGPDGQALDIIERTDWARQAIVDELAQKLAKGKPPNGPEILAVVEKHISRREKQVLAVPELIELAGKAKTVGAARLEKLIKSDAYNLHIAGKRYTARQIERLCRSVNPSFYLFRADVFYRGVRMIDNNNAQREFYITDIVRLLSGVRDESGAGRYRVRAVPVDSPDCIQGFNSPDELVVVQDYVRRKKAQRHKKLAIGGRPRLKPTQYATAQQWIEKIETRKPSLTRWLRRIYGPNDNLHEQKCKALVEVLRCYGKRFGFDEKVCVVRAPGRINMMGRHVDHRGGMTNFLAIDRETIAVAGLRNDDDVAAVNREPKRYRPVHFNIAQLIGRFGWSEWLNFVNSDWVRKMVHSAAGDWGNYIKAAVVRLQHRYQDVKIHGVNLAVSGNVPSAAGLSSSSTVVAAALQATIVLNNFQITPQQFVDLSGEGEWFVGSRGGPAEHAAIYLGQRGKIAQVGYLPFRVEKIIDAPSDYQLLIADSHIKADRHSAQQLLGARIAAFNLGLALLKQRCPEIAHAVEHLRDLDPLRLGCSISDVYRRLLKVPDRMTRKDFRTMLSGNHTRMLESNFQTHAAPECYRPRALLLYGLAEIVRSRMCIDYLEAGRVDELGNLMKVSHDGDRVSRPGPDGQYVSWRAASNDDYFNRLIADLACEDPQKVLRAQLYMQPGSYACSTPEIDRMVDVAVDVPGVAGAQIAGAGLGGCIMVLAKNGRAEAVRKALAQKYYRPARLKPTVIPCVAVEGAGLAEF